MRIRSTRSGHAGLDTCSKRIELFIEFYSNLGLVLSTSKTHGTIKQLF